MGPHDKGEDYEPVELVEQPQVQTSFHHKPPVRVQNENSSEDEAEEQGGYVDVIDNDPALDDETAEEAPVFGVGAECQDPEVCQERQGGGDAWE